MSDTSVVIVAVPSNADSLPGPEDKHCTLQYLGKIGDTAAPTLEDSMTALVRAVSEAAANNQPFSLDVDRIGPLGPDGASVWFLDDAANGLMAELRQSILTPEVTALIDAGSFTKHPEFIPHVTIGYNVDGSVTDEAKTVTSIPFYAVELWWGGQHILFPLGSLADATLVSKSLQSLAIIDINGDWHHPYTGKFVRKPWEFDGTLKALFPEDVTTMVDQLTDSPKGSSWEDIYRLRKNLRQLAKDPGNEHLIDASWAKVADLRHRYSLAVVKNTDAKGKPKQDGLPTMEAVDAVMDLVEEGLEFLETAWMYDNYGADENPDQEMLPLGPQDWGPDNPTPDESPSSFAIEQDAVADRVRFLALMDMVHRLRRSDDALAVTTEPYANVALSAGQQFAKINSGKLSQVLNALTGLGDVAGVNTVKVLARNGDRNSLNGWIDGKVKTLEKSSKALETFLAEDPATYANPYAQHAPRKAPKTSASQRSAAATKAAKTRASKGPQKRAPAGTAAGGQFVDDPATAANKCGSTTSANGIRSALQAGHVAKAQQLAETYLNKVDRTLNTLYDITFAAGTVLASGGSQEATMTTPTPVLAKWEGPLGFEGQFTGDNRMIAPGALTWADTFPQPLRWAAEDIGAHDGARVIGTIEGMSRLEEPMEWEGQTLPVGTIFGWGTFDLDSDLGQEAQRHVVTKLSNGVSLDLDKVSAEMLEAADVQTELGLSLDDAIEDRAVTLIRGARNRAATLVALPAFEGARIQACEKWSHEKIPVSAEKLRATLTSLATNGVAAFAGIRVDTGGHWGVTVPKVGYRWVDMPNIALENLTNLVEDQHRSAGGDDGAEVSLKDALGSLPDIASQVKAAFESKDPKKIEEAQHAVQDVLDNFPFEDYASDSVKGFDEEAGTDPATSIKQALEGFVAQDPHDVVDALKDPSAEVPESAATEPTADAPSADDGSLGALDSMTPDELRAVANDMNDDRSGEAQRRLDGSKTGGDLPEANAGDQGAELPLPLPKSNRAPLNPYMTQDDASLQRNLEILQEDLVAAQKKVKKSHTPENIRAINQIVKEKAALQAEIERRKNEAASTDAPAADTLDYPDGWAGPENHLPVDQLFPPDKIPPGWEVITEGGEPGLINTEEGPMGPSGPPRLGEGGLIGIMSEPGDPDVKYWLPGASPGAQVPYDTLEEAIAAAEQYGEHDDTVTPPTQDELPEGVHLMTPDEISHMTDGQSLDDIGAVAMVQIDPKLLGQSPDDPYPTDRDSAVLMDDGNWYYAGSPNIPYTTIQDYIARNQVDPQDSPGAPAEDVSAPDAPSAPSADAMPAPADLAQAAGAAQREAQRISDNSSLDQRERFAELARILEELPSMDPQVAAAVVNELRAGAGSTPDMSALMEKLQALFADVDPSQFPDSVWQQAANVLTDYDPSLAEQLRNPGDMAVKSDPLTVLTELSTEDLEFFKRENWVEKAGGLPKYIREIADHLIEKGMDQSHAIATAVNTVKRWARAGSAAKGKGGHVSAETVAKAQAALAEWEAKRAASHVTAVEADLVAKFGSVPDSIFDDLDEMLFQEVAAEALTVVNDLRQEQGLIEPGTREPRDLEADMEQLDESIQQVQEAKAAAVRHNETPKPSLSRDELRQRLLSRRPPVTVVAEAGPEAVVASGTRITVNSTNTSGSLTVPDAQNTTIQAWDKPPTSDYDRETVALLASGAGQRQLAAPIKPPREWFEDPKFRGAAPLTVTKDGRVFGHLALWGSCHTGVDGQCLTVPKSYSDYSLFHLGVVECEDGSEVAVGRLAMNTGHANDTFGSRKAIAHYENTGLAIADLRAGEDRFGIWVAGALRPDATPEQIRALKASPLSGDWRHNPATNSLDLVMALAVNQPGFTVPRPKFLVASGAVRTLTAAGMVAPAKVSKINVARALAGDADAAADIRYLQKLAAEARRAEAQQLKVKVLESTGARRRIKEMAASLALKTED